MTLRFANPHARILVVGDLMIDHYLWGGVERISPEAPVPVVDVVRETETLGGAGNVVANLLAFGAHVLVASVLGEDADGEKVAQLLAGAGIAKTALVLEPGRRTSRKSRLMGGHQQVLRFDSESKAAINTDSEDALLRAALPLIEQADVVLLSDYGKGVLTTNVCKRVITAANAAGHKVLVDPKGKDYSKYGGAYTVTPNRKEASIASDLAIKDDASLKQALLWMRNQLQLAVATITLSEEGIAFMGSDDVVHNLPTFAKDVYDVTGAGDTVLAALGFAMANSWDMEQACRFANLAAAVVVGKVGSATATLPEIQALTLQLDQKPEKTGLVDRESLTMIIKHAQELSKTVVFTNGCFDILHVGHLALLEEARAYGDMLVVGINADASVSRLKGPTRPVNSQEDRAKLLAGLTCVNYVTVFEEDTPYELLEALRPDILVKGGDYKVEDVVGRDLVKEVRLVGYVAGKSTTSILARGNAAVC